MGGARKSAYFKGILIFVASGLATACSPAKTETPSINASCDSRVSSIYAGPTEPTYCSTTTDYSASSPQTITGTATFEARPYTVGLGLGAIGAPQKIKFAEVAVFNSSGQKIQCGQTDVNGAFSLSVPQSTSAYKVRVFARANNSMLKASVLNCPEENEPYYVDGTVVADGTQTAMTIHATAENTGEVVGGAFNIFDQLLLANDFFRDEINPTFVAPKVSVYWVKGFNPNTYFNDPDSGLSFYLPSYRRLYILGGVGGDIYEADTDHFDNSVILHEYGHFLEDVYTDTDSPGGAHSGNSLVDPRLAWGEGWGNFIQAAIRDDSYYRDTFGTPNAANPVASSAYIFKVPLETSGGCTVGSDISGCDLPAYPYEGNFREFSITRALWDIFDSTAAGNNTASDETVQNAFSEIWEVLTWNQGFLDTDLAFRNIGLLYDLHANRLPSSTPLTEIHSDHSQGDSIEYARYIDNTDTCGKVFSMDPLDNFPVEDMNLFDSTKVFGRDYGTFSTSHLLRNNNFYHYKHSGGAFNLSVKVATTNTVTGVEPDVDLYLYSISGRYGNSNDIKARADNFWDNNPATEQVETITLTNLAAGDYLINVKLFTGRYLLDSNSSTNNCVGSGPNQVCENDPAPRYNFVPAGDDITYELVLTNGTTEVNLCPASLP